ncbi:hypothetical protein QR680_010340 [Steinernema hermaphroditum]|uniref:Zinc carboxypeptidase A 1 n=1 Tax=Steinernema hermaphroditum TaxID=289476 RepID=A0AA39MBJ1_9BILA|nr:hypothetical protein QR680_010340 [Steinernema hermaphroditum]
MRSFGLAVLVAIVAAVNSKVFTVLRITPETQDQVDFLKKEYLQNAKLDFWKEATTVGEQVHVMVRDTRLDDFVQRLNSRNITHTVMIDDVEKVIKKREEEADKRRSMKVYRDSPRDHVRFNLARYHSFADMINYLNALAVSFPDRVHVMPIGTTHEGRQIPLIKIGTRTRPNKPAIWIDGGIHAREWVSPAAVLFMIDQLVGEYHNVPTIKSLVDNLDWYIVPLLNPDGYEFSRSSTDPETRLWRKNRSPPICKQTPTGLFTAPRTECCQGVDLNRNFDWFFGEVGASTDPCSEIFNGAAAFSEPETAAVRDFISARTSTIKTFLTFHSYSQILMFPFGHAVRTYPNDVQDLRSTAMRAAQALKNVYGTNYVVGTGADTLYPASGGSEDWAKGKMGMKYSFLFELRPEENVWDGFLLAENQILPTARETWEAVKLIAQQTLSTFGSRHEVGTPTPFTSRHCVDLDSLCPYWAQNGACQAWPSMRDRCPKICGFC